jgi:hypothetical protein
MTAPNTTPGNTDPATFVSIGQDPNFPPGWNVVTLSTGDVWKFGGIVERIALTENRVGGQIGPDGPVITPEIAVQLEAAGATIPPIHETKVIPPAPATPAPSAPPATAPTANAPAATSEPPTPAATHESLLQEVEAHAASFGRAVEADVKAALAKVRAIFDAAVAAAKS